MDEEFGKFGSDPLKPEWKNDVMDAILELHSLQVTVSKAFAVWMLTNDSYTSHQS